MGKARKEIKKIREQKQEKENAKIEENKQVELEKIRVIEEAKRQEAITNTTQQDELGKAQKENETKGRVTPNGAGAGTEWLDKEEDEEIFKDFFF